MNPFSRKPAKVRDAQPKDTITWYSRSDVKAARVVNRTKDGILLQFFKRQPKWYIFEDAIFVYGNYLIERP